MDSLKLFKTVISYLTKIFFKKLVSTLNFLQVTYNLEGVPKKSARCALPCSEV